VTSGALGLLGWGLLGALIAAGVAVVIFVAAGEKTAQTAPPAPDFAKAPDPENEIPRIELEGNRPRTPDKVRQPDKKPSGGKDRTQRFVEDDDRPPRNEAEYALLHAAAKQKVGRDWDGALKLYNRIAQSTNKQHRVVGLTGMAQALFELRDVERAETVAGQALIVGGGLDARMHLANALFRQGKFKKAREQCQKIISLSHGKPSGSAQEARILLRQIEVQEKERD
jgi:tetratricopeptide (TPR) repeat protein